MVMRGKRGDAIQREAPNEWAKNFSDVKPPLTFHQAVVEADRCYFCFDAPCVEACPTHIDIPSFIAKLKSGNVVGSAKDILDANIFGAMCARVCPVESLCEEACVRNTAEDKPVAIGLLQRVGPDKVFEDHVQLYERSKDTGHSVAVVGAGPAGLSCAHRLAILGHRVTVFEARPKLGGLNEYGIAAYKVTDDIAQREIAYLLDVGGIQVRAGVQVGRDIPLGELRRDYDAVFLAIGLGGVNALGVEGESAAGVVPAVRFIESIRQAADLSSLRVGRNVIVVGGGMTAIDIATQCRLLGADQVTMLNRSGPKDIRATWYERRVAQTRDVQIRYWAKPAHIQLQDGHVVGVEVERTHTIAGGLVRKGDREVMSADTVFTAIGQKIVPDALDAERLSILDTESKRIVVDTFRKTSLDRVWAGGDCIGGKDKRDLTVTSVQDGKVAARSIHRFLTNEDPIEAERRLGINTNWAYVEGGSRKGDVDASYADATPHSAEVTWNGERENG